MKDLCVLHIVFFPQKVSFASLSSPFLESAEMIGISVIFSGRQV